MTNPAVETIADSTPDPDVSFLADFEANVMGKEGESFSTEPERSSAPESDATASDPVVPAPPEPKADVAGDPAPKPTDEPAIPEGTPFPYTVNGQQKTVDWALKIGEEGAVIPPQHIGKLQDLIQRDEWQREQNQALYAKTQQYEALTHKVGDNEYTGLEAFRQLQAEKAMLDASGGRVMAALADPDFVTNLALAYQSGEQAQVQQVLSGVLQQVKFAGERAQFDTLRTIAEQVQTAARQQETTHAQTTEYQGLIAQIGKALPALTPDDLREMHDYFGNLKGQIFRQATLQEAQQLGVKPGSIIRDPTMMNQWAQSRAAIRSQNAEAVAAANKAAQENAARQAKPVVPAKNAKRPVPPKGEKKPGAMFEGDDGTYAAWKKRLEVGKWAHDDAGSDT